MPEIQPSPGFHLPDPRAIRAVSLDVGGTLLAPWPSVGHIYAEEVARMGLGQPQPEKINEHFARAWAERADFNYSRQAWAALVQKTLEGLTPDPGNAQLFQGLYAAFTHPERWKVLPGMTDFIHDLGSLGLQLAILSNWDERLQKLLLDLGLSQSFSAILVSCELGVQKPDPAAFARLSQTLSLKPSQILHVGDSRREDFQGAVEAGFQAVHLRGSSDARLDLLEKTRKTLSG